MHIRISQELVADSDRSFHRGRDGIGNVGGGGGGGGGVMLISGGGGKDNEKDP